MLQQTLTHLHHIQVMTSHKKHHSPLFQPHHPSGDAHLTLQLHVRSERRYVPATRCLIERLVVGAIAGAEVNGMRNVLSLDDAARLVATKNYIYYKRIAQSAYGHRGMPRHRATPPLCFSVGSENPLDPATITQNV
jgi:hypothetical protein